MPYTMNGVGTHYYGKRNVFRRQGTCEHCKVPVTLESYDTTLFVVLLYVPIFSLGDKRVIDECPSCHRHRVAKHDNWVRFTREAGQELLSTLRANPKNNDASREAAATALAYQDEECFNAVAREIAGAGGNDAVTHNLLAEGFMLFGRLREAEEAYRASLAIADDQGVRVRLAVNLIQQSRPDEAEPYLTRIDRTQSGHKSVLYLLARGYLDSGRHRQAADTLARIGQTFPEEAQDREYRRLNKAVTKRYGRSAEQAARPVRRDRMLRQSTPPFWPKLIGPAWIVVLTALLLGSSLALGRARTVFVVNGLERGYTVQLNGVRRHLPPRSHIQVKLPEGKIRVRVLDRSLALPDQECTIKNPFLLRPFIRKSYVLNPDRTAVLLWEEILYVTKEHRPDARDKDLKQKYRTGALLYPVEGVDYIFRPSPKNLTMEEDEERRWRLSMLETTEPGELMALVLQETDAGTAADYARRQALLHPEEIVYLSYMTALSKPAEALALLRQKLADRPLRIDWHRTYQSLAEKAEPNRDLAAEYRGYLSADPENPALLYLLGRVVPDPDEAEALFRRASAGPAPCAHAFNALAVARLQAGDFAAALSMARRALALSPGKTDFLEIEREAMEGGGLYDELYQRVEARVRANPYDPALVEEKIGLLVALGRPQEATLLIEDFYTKLRDGVAQEVLQKTRTYLEAVYAYRTGSMADFRQKAALLPEHRLWQFATALSVDKLAEAASQVKDLPDQASAHLLLYIAGTARGQKELADTHLASALALLRTGDADDRAAVACLSADEPPAAKQVACLTPMPDQLKIVLAALGCRFPAARARFFAQAQRLNYNRDFPHWFLREVMSSSGR